MAIKPVEVRFAVGGVGEVLRAFTTIEGAALKAEAGQTRAARKDSSERTSVAKDEAKAKTQTAEQAAREQIRAWQSADRMIAQAHKDAAREIARDEADKARDAARWLHKREADERASLQRRQQAYHQFSRAISGGVANGVGRSVGIAGSLVGAAMQIGGGFSIADSVSREVRLTGQAATIAASSQADPDGKKWRTAEVLSKSRSTANAYSMDPEEILKGVGKFKDLTGNLGEAVKLAPHMAKLATALGADPSELMENAGNAFNAGLRGDDLTKMARVQTMQGMQGAVELKDMAKYGARLTGGASLFGGDRAENIATMGALAQVARQHGPATTAAEATMGALRFATDITKHSAKLEGAGIKVSDGHGTLRSSRDIIRDMLEKTGGDVTKLSALGLGDRGVKPLMGFASIYRDAGGGDKGKEAVLKEFDKYTKGVSDEAVDEAAKQRLSEVDKQVTKAMNELRDAVGTNLLPEFTKLIPVIKDMTPAMVSVMRQAIPAFGDAIKSVADFVSANRGMIDSLAANPIGAIIALEVTKSVGNAALQGSFGKVAQAATGLAAVLVAGMIAIDAHFDGKAKQQSASVSLDVAGGGMATKLAHGQATPEEAKAMAGKLAADLARQKYDAAPAHGSFLDTVMSQTDIGKEKTANENKAMASTAESLERLNKAIAASEAAFSSGTLGRPGGGAAADNASSPGNPARSWSFAESMRGGTN